MSESDNDENKVEPTLEPLLQAHIGKQLRNMYDAMTREPVPERFKLLLDQLEAGENPDGQVQENARKENARKENAGAGANKAGAA
jgi:Anti-sigma factor NepR